VQNIIQKKHFVPFDNMVVHIIKYVSICNHLIMHDNISHKIIFSPHDNNQTHIKHYNISELYFQYTAKYFEHT
jgi:hypothetical protein